MENQEEGVHPCILNSIHRLQQLGDNNNDQGDEENRQQQRRLEIYHDEGDGINRHSVQFLVDFLRGEGSQHVKELVLRNCYLVQPSDGGQHVLRDFFADTMLTKVEFYFCNFGSAAEVLQLLSAFETNTMVEDLNILYMCNLEGAEVALGTCLSGLLQHNTRLLRLDCSLVALLAAEVHALQPRLQTNRHLKELALTYCQIGDEGFGLLVDALLGNTTLEKLDISWNRLTPACLGDVTRLVEFTRIKEITCIPYRNSSLNQYLTNDSNAMQHFNRILLQKNTSLEKISGSGFDDIVATQVILSRNRGMNRAQSLLALQPRTGSPIPSKCGIWYKAFAKLARRYNEHEHVYPGVSAIFKILQARPALLEKQLQRPTAAAASRETHQSSTRSSTIQEISDNHNGGMKPSSTDNGPKRQRLE